LWFGTPEPALGGLVLLHGGEGVVHIPVVRLICGDGGGAPPPNQWADGWCHSLTVARIKPN